jgi:hypothetical protein
MTKGNQIADLIKSQAHLLPFAIDIIMGREEYEAVINNPEPCDPPDFAPDESSFCGVPTRGGSVVRSRLDLVLDLYKLPGMDGTTGAN